jgi:hypothetical protein
MRLKPFIHRIDLLWGVSVAGSFYGCRDFGEAVILWPKFLRWAKTRAVGY